MANILRSLALGGSLFLAGVATAVTAQKYSDSQLRQEQQRAVLSGAEHMEVIVSVAEYPPGEFMGRHIHHGLEAAYIIDGAEVEVPGKGTISLPTGKAVLNLRDVPHGGMKVTGEQTLRLFTVHIVDRDKPLYDFIEK